MSEQACAQDIMAQLLDENRKLERCLAIITELANGEKDHSPSVVDLSDHGEDVDTPAMTPTTQPLSLSIRSESAIANDSQANEGQSTAMTTTHKSAAKTKARLAIHLRLSPAAKL